MFFSIWWEKIYIVVTGYMHGSILWREMIKNGKISVSSAQRCKACKTGVVSAGRGGGVLLHDAPKAT
jgi:hypothetical protein